MSPRKNPHAIALGRRGGKANTPAQAAARAQNGRKGGRPSIYRLTATGHVERRERGTWHRLEEPLDRPARAWLRRYAGALSA